MRFQFNLEDSSGQTYNLNPLFQTISFNWAKQDNECYYRKDIQSTLKFNKEDFDTLRLLDDQNEGCDNVFSIQDLCNTSACTTSSGQTVFNGFLNVKSGSYNCDTCIVSNIKPENVDEYSCLLDNCEEEINIFDCTSARTDASLFYGEIECVTCTSDDWIVGTLPLPNDVTFEVPTGYYFVNDCVPSNEAWSVTMTKIESILVGSPNPVRRATVTTTYCRETYNGTTAPNSDPNWIQINSTTWVRPLQTSLSSTVTLSGGSQSLRGTQWFFSASGYNAESGTTYDFTNGICLCELLECYAEDCNLSAVSNFFDCNVDNTHDEVSGNTAYTYRRDCLKKIFIFQKSDIVKARTKDESATIGKLSFCKFKDFLKKVYNVCVVIDDDILRYEHVSYFNQRKQISNIDLTDPKYKKYVDGKMSYSYGNNNLPYRETWEWQDDVNSNFESCDFIYSCGERSKTETYEADCINTDINFLTSAQGEDLELEGFVLIGIDEQGVVTQSDGVNNDCHAWCPLQLNLHNYNRPLPNALVSTDNTFANGFDVGSIDFDSSNRVRELKNIKIPLCCSDFHSFNPNELINTKLGVAEVVNATYDSFSETLLLELLV